MEKEIKFVRYNDYSLNHREIIDKLNNDLASRTYLGSNLYDNIANTIRLSEEDIRNGFYIVKVDDIEVGIISLTNRGKNTDTFEIDIGIIPEYRHQGLAELISNTFTDFIFKRFDNINELYVKIDKRNKNSIKLFVKQDFELFAETNDHLIYKKSRVIIKENNGLSY